MPFYSCVHHKHGSITYMGHGMHACGSHTPSRIVIHHHTTSLARSHPSSIVGLLHVALSPQPQLNQVSQPQLAHKLPMRHACLQSCIQVALSLQWVKPVALHTSPLPGVVAHVPPRIPYLAMKSEAQLQLLSIGTNCILGHIQLLVQVC